MDRAPDIQQKFSQHSRQLLTALSRIDSILPLLQDPCTSAGDHTIIESLCEALLFNLERAAWSAIELANLWVFQIRIGIPRKENESFDLLSKAGLLPVDTARKLRQATEYRNLSHREARLLDWNHFKGGLESDLSLLHEWNDLVKKQVG
jgi:uncharacterized protein YutE (UPF0331/DUF86 family)